MEKIKNFLKTGNYEGRRLRQKMDDSEIEFVAQVITNILLDKPKELYEYNLFKYDSSDKYPYVDMAYYTPIFDYLTHTGLYKKIFAIPCPNCKKDFTGNKDFDKSKISSFQKCHYCNYNFDLREEHNTMFGPSSYLLELETYYKLVKKK